MKSILDTPAMYTSAAVDVTEDVSLPDYVPEIRRILGVRAGTSVDGKFLTGDAVETDGAVVYTVLYTGADGNPAQFSQSTPYTGRIPIQFPERDGDIPQSELVISASAEQAGCRVTAPRRITLSSRVKLCAMRQAEKDMSVKVPGGREVRRKNGVCQTAAVTDVRGSGEASGEIREKEGTKVTMAWAEMAFGEVRMNAPAGKITVKGDVYMTVLAESPDGILTLRSRSPVEEILPMPAGSEGRNCRGAAFGNIVLIEVEADETGTVRWRTEYDIDCAVMTVREAEITEDAYLIGCEDALTFETAEYCAPVGCINGRLTVTGAMKIRPEMQVIAAWGSVSGERCTVKDGKLLTEGSVRVECVLSGGGEMMTEEVQIPLKYECDALGDGDGGIMAKVKAAVTDVSVRPDGSVTAEIAAAAAVLGKKSVSAVTSVTAGGMLNGRKNLLRLYVPDAGETAWDVEKRFRLAGDAVPEGRVYVI